MGKVIVVEHERLEETYLVLGPWDEDIGHEKFSELYVCSNMTGISLTRNSLMEGRLRDTGFDSFDGNLLRHHGQKSGGLPLKNET
jgi:hypothetical protein